MLLTQNLLINALNKGLISITGPVFNMMEIKEVNGQQREGAAPFFLSPSLIVVILSK